MPKFAFKLHDGGEHYEQGTVFIDRHPDLQDGDSRYIDSAREYLRRKELKRCLFRLTDDQLTETREKITLLEAAGKTRSEPHAALLTHDQEEPRTLVYLIEVPSTTAASDVHRQRRADTRS